MSHHTIPYHTKPFHTLPYHTIPYHTLPCHHVFTLSSYPTRQTIFLPCHTIPYHTLPSYVIPYPHPKQLIFQDQYENVTGTDLNGKIEICINKAPQTSEVPMLQGNVQKTEIPLVNGTATVQTLSIEQNTAGKDGQEYVLSFTVNVTGRRQNIPPFNLPFLFYNGKIRNLLICLPLD